MTSPPYYSLRNYRVEGQYGLEADYRDYVRIMVCVFHEVKRVTKKHGSFYLNIGDTYSAKPIGTFNGGGKEFVGRDMSGVESSGNLDKTLSGITQKSLMMIPERIALGMIDDGWILRNKIIWNKRNHMPSSVKDRLTNGYEIIYHFVKNRKYFYNLDAIRIPQQYPLDVARRIKQDKEDGIDPFAKDSDIAWRRGYHARGKIYPNQMAYRQELWEERGLDSTYQFNKEKRYKGKFANSTAEESEEYNSPRARNMRKQDNVPGRNHSTYEGFNDRWKNKHVFDWGSYDVNEEGAPRISTLWKSARST